MNSLRVRLILGVALVALVPLLVAMFFLSQRIQQTVRAQADDRLAGALGILRAQLVEDGQRLDERLALLGRDPALRRLVLLEPRGSRDLAEYLAEKRFLLGLDFLAVTDTAGRLIADGTGVPAPSGTTGVAPSSLPELRAGAFGLHLAAFADPGAMALTASAPIPYRGVPAGEVRGGVVVDAAFLERLRRSSGVSLELVDADGRRVATPGAEGGGATGLGSWIERNAVLPIGPRPHPVITGRVSTAAADGTVAALRTASILLGLLGIAIAIALGTLWSWQVSRPVERLARFSERIARGEWNEPLEVHSVRELETLVTALDRMRRDLHVYRERLVVSERHAAWSQMARRVAHEVKNPLTPIAISIADLKRSHEQGRPEFPQILDRAVRTIGEEIETLKRLLQEFSDFGRMPAPSFGTCAPAELMDDLEALYRRDAASGRLRIDRAGDPVSFSADRAQLRQALVNLVKNGLEATAPDGHVDVAFEADDGALTITVRDDGPGLTEAQRAGLFVPDFTTKPHGSGLGLAIVERIVADHGGTIDVTSAPGRGAAFRIRLPRTRENA